jgi:hypothetical protein
MHEITPDAVVIGVDTHKDVHVAVAVSGLGARLGTASFPLTPRPVQLRRRLLQRLITTHISLCC